eukprot:COSAG01_NODE_55018_length_328_cov_0.676856_1_plen_88_part_01
MPWHAASITSVSDARCARVIDPQRYLITDAAEGTVSIAAHVAAALQDNRTGPDAASQAYFAGAGERAKRAQGMKNAATALRERLVEEG